MSLQTSEEINYQFLLLTHMVCADEQIHSEEAKALQELAQQANIGTRTIEEMEKILSQDEHLIPLAAVARQLPPGEQNEAMRQIIAIGYIDGYFSPLEREMVNQIAEIWNWPDTEIEKLLKQVENSVGVKPPENLGRKIEQLRQEILLAGQDYDDAIHKCKIIANEDYNFAKNSLRKADSALAGLAENLEKTIEIIQQKAGNKGKGNTAKEVAKQLEFTKKSLTAETLKELKGVGESLLAKQRALNHFSIAFIGKTKAGKSTLHAIITDGGWEAIGVGKQRTTRFNRVYEWKNIRIIDTPGIGAPGGKSDEEIAQSIIEESDIICYVVTNDSIQETEFQFLQLLKEKAKPLIILLNIKNNLRDPRRLEHFLNNPDKLFVMDTSSGLGGHIERIRRYAKQHYANDYFDIIPVMLLAAQMSRESEHQQHREKLFKASRIQDFLNSIRVSLVEQGMIRRSQTLLGSTVGAIDKTNQWINQQLSFYQNLTNQLKNTHDKFEQDVKKAARDKQEYLLQQIKAVFQDAFDTILPFAERNWDTDEIQLISRWENRLRELKFEDRLNHAVDDSVKKFNHEVQELLEELGTELQLLAKLGVGNFNLKQQDTIIFKDLFRIGGNLLTIAGAVPMFFAPPVRIFLGIAATILGLISNFFKSKEQKRREAVENICNTLNKQLDDNQQKTVTQAKQEFSQYCDGVALNLNNYFEQLIPGLETIITQLEKTKKKLDDSANYLNRAYAKRIIDWCLDKYEPLTDEVILKTIGQVQRDFGKNIIITTKSDCHVNKSQETIKKVLQEDIAIQANRY